MSVEFKVGDKVIPKKSTLEIWSDSSTRGKVYTVVYKENRNCTIVYDDGGVGYWSSPEKYFTKAEIYLGGE